jgi:hypothetical protein
MGMNTIIMNQHDIKKETNEEVHGGLSTLLEDIMTEKQSHGTTRTIMIKIRVEI